MALRAVINKVGHLEMHKMIVKITGEKPEGITFNVSFESKAAQIHGKNVGEFRKAIET